MKRHFYDLDHSAFGETVRKFMQTEVTPHYDAWETAGIISREMWERAGAQGLLGLSIPKEYGGPGVTDYRFRMRMIEEMCQTGATSVVAGVNTQEDVVIPYLTTLGTDAQKQRWLPDMGSGRSIGAVAMTEPDVGSDLQAVRTRAVRSGEGWVINGQKTFITNGVNSDFAIVVAKTDPNAGAKGISLFVVEKDTPGFQVGRNLTKVGLRGQDTAELFFEDVQVTEESLLGDPGRGFGYLMEALPRERLAVAVVAVAGARTAFDQTVRYCFERRAFKQRIGDFQNSRFELADMATRLDVAQSHLEAVVNAFNGGDLSGVDAAKVKWWTTELQNDIVDKCVQLHGGYGYMMEYPIARAFIDSRVQRLYGGTTEIMKEIIGRDIARQQA